jgi:hypothetical protein
MTFCSLVAVAVYKGYNTKEVGSLTVLATVCHKYTYDVQPRKLILINGQVTQQKAHSYFQNFLYCLAVRKAYYDVLR